MKNTDKGEDDLYDDSLDSVLDNDLSNLPDDEPDSDADAPLDFGDEESGEDAPVATGKKTEDSAPDWEKRFKDTERAFHQQQQEIAELKRQNETKIPEPEADDFDFESAYDEDPAAALAEMQKRTDAKIARAAATAAQDAVAAANEQSRTSALDKQEADAREAHGDYDEIVNSAFIARLKSDSSLRQKWQDGGATAEAAYTLAHRAIQFEAFLETGEMPEPNKPKDRKAPRKRTLSGMGGHTNPQTSSGKSKYTHDGALDSILK